MHTEGSLEVLMEKCRENFYICISRLKCVRAVHPYAFHAGVLLVSFYSITAPIGVAIGIGVASSYNSKSVARNATEVGSLLLVILV